MEALGARMRWWPINSDEQTSTVELLQRMPLDELEETVKSVRERGPAQEVREAVVERLANAPLAEFGTLKHIYVTHHHVGGAKVVCDGYETGLGHLHGLRHNQPAARSDGNGPWAQNLAQGAFFMSVSLLSLYPRRADPLAETFARIKWALIKQESSAFAFSR